jgi:hypothetical protein
METRISEGAGYLVVSAEGDLSLRTVPDLRDALLKASAEQPRGLVCDLRGVRATRESLTILHVVADQVADWPSSPLAIVATAQPLLDQLGRLGLRRRLPVVPDLEQAAAALRYVADGRAVGKVVLDVSAPQWPDRAGRTAST